MSIEVQRPLLSMRQAVIYHNAKQGWRRHDKNWDKKNREQFDIEIANISLGK